MKNSGPGVNQVSGSQALLLLESSPVMPRPQWPMTSESPGVGPSFYFLKLPEFNLRTRDLGHVGSEAKRSCAIDSLVPVELGVCHVLACAASIKREREVDLSLFATDRWAVKLCRPGHNAIPRAAMPCSSPTALVLTHRCFLDSFLEL